MASITAPRRLQKSDDRKNFDCGRTTLNHWLQRHAWGNEQGDTSRTYVMLDETPQRIVGYVTLVTGQIERAFLPHNRQRNKPDPVPVILLGQLAVDQDYQGRGYAADLLRHALAIALEASASIGFAGVITHPIDDTARQFYTRWGFTNLAEDPKGSMILFIRDIQHSMLHV